MKRRNTPYNTPAKRTRRNLFGAPPNQGAIVRALRSATETKYHLTDIINSSTGTNNHGTFWHITDIASGDRVDDRIGNKLLVTHLKVRLATQQTGSIRVCLLCPKVPTQDMTTTTIRETRFTGFDRGQYWVFYDQLFSTSDTQTSGGNVCNIDLPRNQRVEYQGATSSASTMARNPIYLYVYAENAANSNARVDGYAEVFYKDI